MMVAVHLLTLHYTGSSAPGGTSATVKIKFRSLFLIKDLVNVILV
jgi:quinol-cytochrome oxidoreductase complex cytochrome b subunit